MHVDGDIAAHLIAGLRRRRSRDDHRRQLNERFALGKLLLRSGGDRLRKHVFDDRYGGRETGGSSTGTDPVDPAADCIEVPQSNAELISPEPDRSAIEAAIAQAQPGEHILLPPGTFQSVTFAFEGGQLGAEPIVARPADPSDPPIFTGSNEVSGDNIMLLGARFDATGTPTSGRMLRIRSVDTGVFAYLEFDKTDNIAIELEGNVTNTRVHRVHIRGTGSTVDDLNGGEGIKAGVSGTGGVLRNNQIDHSFIEDVFEERETISVKEGGLSLYRITFSNCKDLSIRHGVAARIEECVGMRDLVVTGPNHLVRNCETEQSIEVWSGSFDGSTPYGDIPNGDGDIYLSSVDARLEHSVGSLLIGNASYQGGAFVAQGTVVADHIGSINTDLGATYDSGDPKFPASEPLRMSAESTGLAGYALCSR